MTDAIHPEWCDLQLCTATFPAQGQDGPYGSHRSAPTTLGENIHEAGAAGITGQLTEISAPWACRTFLTLSSGGREVASVDLSEGGEALAGLISAANRASATKTERYLAQLGGAATEV